MMKISASRFTVSVLAAILLLVLPQAGLARQTITLDEALELVLSRNTGHTLFLRQQELALNAGDQERQPRIDLAIVPGEFSNGRWETEGSLAAIIPLARGLELSGGLKVALAEGGLRVAPTADLDLNYEFFALTKQAEAGPTPEESLRNQINNLVMQTVDLCVQLREKLDLTSYEERYYRYLTETLEAAQLTPGFDDLKIRKELRSQETLLATARAEVDQLQHKLAALLGYGQPPIFQPRLDFELPKLGFDREELWAELMTTSPELRQARAELALAEQQLALERKTRGWDLRATGGISGDPTLDPSWRWSVGLRATKTLYPQNSVLAQLELAVLAAEQDQNIQEDTLRGALWEALQALSLAHNNVELRAEHLEEAAADLALRKRQHEAGLVTELQMAESGLVFQRAELDYDHSRLAVLRSYLALGYFCGWDLQQLILKLID